MKMRLENRARQLWNDDYREFPTVGQTIQCVVFIETAHVDGPRRTRNIGQEHDTKSAPRRFIGLSHLMKTERLNRTSVRETRRAA